MKVEAGTNPLPYVQVGMILHRANVRESTYEVIVVSSAEGEELLVTLEAEYGGDHRTLPAAEVRAEWTLFEEFDPDDA
jgi:hypothetical protein